jgi:hypothetical protein
MTVLRRYGIPFVALTAGSIFIMTADRNSTVQEVAAFYAVGLVLDTYGLYRYIYYS